MLIIFVICIVSRRNLCILSLITLHMYRCLRSSCQHIVVFLIIGGPKSKHGFAFCFRHAPLQ
uniref:Uncharacterized protein n=1 Tax=Rhizophora mucronata TaxID=61149 RepID=A0A2P2QE73_RHIMU